MSDPMENPIPPPSPAPPPPSSDLPSQDARNWAMLAHLSALIGLLIPLGSIVAPLVIWQIKKNEFAFVDDQGKEALNFQITVLIAVLACFVLMFLFIGFLLLPIVGIAALVLTIIGGVKASNGERYRYPLTLRLVN